MLSFELSVIDLILAIAVIILLILYITKLSVKPPTEEKLLVKEKKPSKQLEEDVRLEKEMERLTPKLQTNSTKCPYGFGYLKRLDKAAPIPDKCLGCSRIIECSSADK